MLLQFPTTESQVEPVRFVIHLLLAVLLGQILGWHFVRYAQVLANKRKLARVLVYICATTMMIITVIIEKNKNGNTRLSSGGWRLCMRCLSSPPSQ